MSKQNFLQLTTFAIFDSVLRYAVQVWGQHRNQTIKEIGKLQEKAIRIMSFKRRNDPARPIFKTLEIMKLKDVLLYNNCTFARNQINEKFARKFQRFLSNSSKGT